MARLKTAYREKHAEPRATIPEIRIDDEKIRPSERIDIDNKAEPAEATVAIEPPDEASVALQRQLEHLRQSERAQHEHAMRMQAAQMSQRAQPQTRVEFLQTQGLTKAEAEFFDGNEQMMTHQQEASEAAAEALAAGIERDSPEFFQVVEQGFAKRLDALNQRAAEQPAPTFFQPRTAPSPAASADRSAMYSAPVSRGAIGGTREPSPRSVRLTPAELEIAKAAGITETQYAQNKLRMLRERAAGERD
jgi:hypothetical protein